MLPTRLAGNESVVRSVAFSPDSTRLASGGEDTTIRVWDLRNPNAPPVKLSGHESAVYAVAFSPDGTRLASAGLNGAVRVWRMWSAAADFICTRVWRNLSMDEWRFYVGDDIPYERTCPALPGGAGAPNK